MPTVNDWSGTCRKDTRPGYWVLESRRDVNQTFIGDKRIVDCHFGLMSSNCVVPAEPVAITSLGETAKAGWIKLKFNLAMVPRRRRPNLLNY